MPFLQSLFGGLDRWQSFWQSSPHPRRISKRVV
jgi:hypothetical protein